MARSSPDPVVAVAPQAVQVAASGPPPVGGSPWKTVGRRLRGNRWALGFGALLFLLGGAALGAPLFAEHVARTGPHTNHLVDTVTVDGRAVDIVGPDGIPLGPQMLAADGRFLLGADANGRDVMVRLLYGSACSMALGTPCSWG